MIRLGVVLGGAVGAFLLCAYGVSRLRRALADDAVNTAIRPYRLTDLDDSARLARDQIREHNVRRGVRGYAVIVLDLLAWIALGSALAVAAWPDRALEGWLPYAPAVAVLLGFALLLYLLAHDPQQRPRLRVARLMQRLLPLSPVGYLDAECRGEFDILEKAMLVRSRATQQAARDQVAELAHAILPQARRMADEDLKRSVESAVAFVPRPGGQAIDTDRFAELLTLFDALFGRLRDDTGHQDIWRIAILRQLIRYTGPNVLPQIFGELTISADGTGTGDLSVTRGRRDDPSVLDTAFGRFSEAQGLGLIVDLTRDRREHLERDDLEPDDELRG
jgi:hypothetical protein